MKFDNREEHLLLCESSRLINIHTFIVKTMSTILSSLENAIHIHVTLNYETKVLEVHLSRLKLNFFLRKDVTQLELKQFRNMFVNAN